MDLLADRFGRTFPYLRLSIIDACNFRCSYCLPNGYRAPPGRSRTLDLDEIARLLRAFASVGMYKVRLTGGEPSLRRDLVPIIRIAAGTHGIRTIALTTNGCLLLKRFEEWHAAGLTALNVSVDSLDSDRFRSITGAEALPDILAGVDQAIAAGLQTVKLNAVLLRGLNDDDLPRWFDYLRDRPVTVRFIELMRTGENREYFERYHVRTTSLENTLESAGWIAHGRAPESGPAREFAHPQFKGKIGVIAPYSSGFCAGCNRLRVTATGDLRLCLFGNVGIPLRPLLQSDDQQEELVATLRGRLPEKQLAHGLHRGDTGITPHLASLGG